jgi:hypothetical protein
MRKLYRFAVPLSNGKLQLYYYSIALGLYMDLPSGPQSSSLPKPQSLVYSGDTLMTYT